jgi:hypothetical protein
LSIYGTGRGKDQVRNGIFSHNPKQVDKGFKIIMVIIKGLLHRFSNRFKGSKMYDSLQAGVGRLPVMDSIPSSTSIPELDRLSTMTTSNPSWISSTVVCEPIYPVPPVTNIKGFIAGSFLV